MCMQDFYLITNLAVIISILMWKRWGRGVKMDYTVSSDGKLFYLVVQNICLPLQCQRRSESLAQLV